MIWIVVTSACESQGTFSLTSTPVLSPFTNYSPLLPFRNSKMQSKLGVCHFLPVVCFSTRIKSLSNPIAHSKPLPSIQEKNCR